MFSLTSSMTKSTSYYKSREAQQYVHNKSIINLEYYVSSLALDSLSIGHIWKSLLLYSSKTDNPSPFQNNEDQCEQNNNSASCFVWLWNKVSCFDRRM
jgi:hypothetical protein